MSIDSWRPEVVRRALDAGATVINAADGMQSDEMWQVASDFDVPIVVPFLSGPNPREMEFVTSDPVQVMVDFFEARLADADRFGLRSRCIVDPGTGFRPTELAVGAALRVPEDRLLEPRPAPPVRASDLHRAALEGNGPARRVARHRGATATGVRPRPLPGEDPPLPSSRRRLIRRSRGRAAESPGPRRGRGRPGVPTGTIPSAATSNHLPVRLSSRCHPSSPECARSSAWMIPPCDTTSRVRSA